jgi:hypothetical protein
MLNIPNGRSVFKLTWIISSSKYYPINEVSSMTCISQMPGREIKSAITGNLSGYMQVQ